MDEKLKRAIGHFIKNIAGEISIKDVSSCPICNDLKEKNNSWRYLGEAWRVELPTAASLLKIFIAFGKEEPFTHSEAYYILRCLDCARLYSHWYAYDFGGGVGPSDEDINVDRKTIEEVIDIVAIRVLEAKDNWWYFDSGGKKKKGKGLE